MPLKWQVSGNQATQESEIRVLNNEGHKNPSCSHKVYVLSSSYVLIRQSFSRTNAYYINVRTHKCAPGASERPFWTPPRRGLKTAIFGVLTNCSKTLSMMINNNIINMFNDINEHTKTRSRTLFLRFLQFWKKFSKILKSCKQFPEIIGNYPPGCPRMARGPKNDLI